MQNDYKKTKKDHTEMQNHDMETKKSQMDKKDQKEMRNHYEDAKQSQRDAK